MIQISKNFTLDELVASVVAGNFKIDNTPTQEAIVNLVLLVVNTLQPLRNLWGRAIMVSSGYRCKTLNDKVGGANESQHMTGEAADISTSNYEDNKKLFDMVIKSSIPYDQLIDEKNYQWIHISFSKNNNKRQVLHL